MRQSMVCMLIATVAGCVTSTPRATAPVATTVAPGPLAIADVGVEPKTFETKPGAVVVIRYRLTQPASVRIDFVDDAGRAFRRWESGPQPAGSHDARWNGQAADGSVVPPGVYRYIIHATGPTGETATYDPSTTSGGEELEARSFTFDAPSRTLRWLMPRAGRARVRLGLQGYPHLRTLIDWTPMEAGPHELTWDGLAASGLIQLAQHPQLSIKLHAFSLPDNTIIVRSDGHLPDPAPAASYPPIWRSDAPYLHARHPTADCHETRLRVEFPQSLGTDAQGRTRVSGSTSVRVTVDEHDARALTNARFEVAVYEDLTFLFEEEEGVNPWTFVWDATRLPPGAHTLTVNTMSYDDHYGVLTVPVVVEPPVTAVH